MQKYVIKLLFLSGYHTATAFLIVKLYAIIISYIYGHLKGSDSDQFYDNVKVESLLLYFYRVVFEHVTSQYSVPHTNHNIIGNFPGANYCIYRLWNFGAQEILTVI